MEPLTIVIIDDDQHAQEVAVAAATLLAEQLGKPVRTLSAHSGIEGLRLLHALPPQQQRLVVLDIHLPEADVDGRLIGPLLRATFPDLPIIPFTGDRQPQMAAELRALGMDAPVLKPVAPAQLAARMAATLAQPPPLPPSPLQDFLADQARQLVALLQQHPVRPVQIALLAQRHLVGAGLAHILGEVTRVLPLTITVPRGTHAALLAAIRQGQVDLLISTPDALDVADAIGQAHGVPVLIYASAHDADAALRRSLSVVVGPTTSAELTQAIQHTLHGTCYRHPQVAAVLGLDPRQRTMVQLLRQGATSAQIAAAIGVSEHRLRHLFTVLYAHLGIPHQRSALLTWAATAPLHLIAPEA